MSPMDQKRVFVINKDCLLASPTGKCRRKKEKVARTGQYRPCPIPYADEKV